MAPRPPADAVVALRSLGRRYRGLFAGLGDDESPDELAHRMGSDGLSASDHVVAATGTIHLVHRALEQVLTQDDPLLHPAVGDPAARTWDSPGGTVDELIDELERAATQLAARSGHVAAEAWSRRGRIADRDVTVGATDLIWDAVDSAVEHLRSAERTLHEQRL